MVIIAGNQDKPKAPPSEGHFLTNGETKMKFKYEMASTATTSIIEIETKNLKQAYDKAAEKLAVPLDTVYALGAKPCH